MILSNTSYTKKQQGLMTGGSQKMSGHYDNGKEKAMIAALERMRELMEKSKREEGENRLI